MKRVLVAGSTGYLGGFVVKELARRGHFVRALARAPRKLNPVRHSIDEVFEGEVTRPETLEGACDDIDAVFSSIGITRQKDGLTFRDVDYQGNVNLLEVAKKAGVGRFVYVSVLRGPELTHLDIVKAHEDFVRVLESSDVESSIIRPTGYFSDMGEFFEMAKRGRVWLIGSGENRVNPIHGADLAVVCADAIEGNRGEIDVGGPEVMSWNEIARLALEVQDKPVRISHVPVQLAWAIVRLTRLVSRHRSELLAFFVTMATLDVVAPATGTRTLENHYRSLHSASD